MSNFLSQVHFYCYKGNRLMLCRLSRWYYSWEYDSSATVRFENGDIDLKIDLKIENVPADLKLLQIAKLKRWLRIFHFTQQRTSQIYSTLIIWLCNAFENSWTSESRWWLGDSRFNGNKWMSHILLSWNAKKSDPAITGNKKWIVYHNVERSNVRGKTKLATINQFKE